MVRPRWPEYVIAVALSALAGAGVWALWGHHVRAWLHDDDAPRPAEPRRGRDADARRERPGRIGAAVAGTPAEPATGTGRAPARRSWARSHDKQHVKVTSNVGKLDHLFRDLVTFRAG